MLKKSELQSLESYLAQIARELRALPPQARDEEMREIEAHLRALVLASQQLENVSQVVATATALKQFGAPHAIGKKLRKAWECKQPEAWWRTLLAPLAGTTSYALLALVIQAAVGLLSPAQFEKIIASGGFLLLTFGAYCLLGVGHFLTGFVMGYISPKRGLLLFLSLLAIFSAIAVWENDITLAVFTNTRLFSSHFYGLIAIMFGIWVGARHGRKRQFSQR